jgi:signal transduction histidine kinase
MGSAFPIIGKRPGDAIGCLHATENDGGCGNTESCRYCKGLDLMLKSISKQTAHSGEVVFTVEREGLYLPLNLLENIAPIFIADQMFYMIELTDISGVQRRKSLERVFFHDILNTSGALKGLVYQNHGVARNKELVTQTVEPVVFQSDFTLLKRILGNMLKNALETTEKRGRVFLGCKAFRPEADATASNEFIEFWVRNRGVIPEPMQKQIFQRPFPPKGAAEASELIA